MIAIEDQKLQQEIGIPEFHPHRHSFGPGPGHRSSSCCFSTPLFRCWPIIIALLSRPSPSVSCFSRCRACCDCGRCCTSQLTFDILLITLLVYLSGGIVSPFYFLYILPIIVASIFLTRRDTMIIATVSFIAFGILSDLLYLGIIPYYPNFEVGDVSLGTFIYNLLMSFIAFASVSIIVLLLFRAHPQHRRAAEKHPGQPAGHDPAEQLGDGKNGERLRHRRHRRAAIVSYNAKAAHVPEPENVERIFSTCCWPRATCPEIQQHLAGQQRLLFRKKACAATRPGHLRVHRSRKCPTFERLLVFLITDLSAIKEIENKLKEKEHLALIGEMAAGIAHEIRNPLASISGSVQFLRQELTLDPELRNLMDIIVKESDRLSAFIEEFLNFSRQSPLEMSDSTWRGWWTT